MKSRILILFGASIALIGTAAFCVAPAPIAPLPPGPPPSPTPRPAGAVAPRLDVLAASEIADIVEAPRRCILQQEGDILLVATEAERGARVKLGARVLALRYQERTPVRNGGRFVGPADAFDVWVSVNPPEDKRLAKGAPRNVTLMINDLRAGGSDVSSATWECNY